MNIYSTSLIEKKDSKGLIRKWIGHVTKQDNTYYINQEYWSIKKNGEESIHQLSEPVLIVRKNIGKSNETTEEEQAIQEINSLFSKKIDEGYHSSGEDNFIFLPMLALKFNDKAIFPAYVQPKIDGIRAFRLPDGTFWTRKGKQILTEVVSHLNVESDVILDGELILPEEYTFQETISAIKKKGTNSNKLIYYIYDCYDIKQPHLTFKNRLEIINKIDSETIRLTNTVCCLNLEQFKDRTTEFIEQGYEGSMYRTIDGIYKVNHRSSDLLKYKEFIEDEYEIIDVVDGKGRELNAAILVCKTKEDKIFNVRPALSIKERNTIFLTKDKYIGKLCTVKFQELTDDNLPRFPVGKAIRDYE